MSGNFAVNLESVLPLEPQTRKSRWPDPIMNFLIAYDIADPKRLKRVAKTMERFARRVQYSLFMFTGSRSDLESELRAVVSHIEPTVDRVQAWPIRTSTKACRIDAGYTVPDTGIALVIAGDDWTVIEAVDDDTSHPPFLIDL